MCDPLTILAMPADTEKGSAFGTGRSFHHTKLFVAALQSVHSYGKYANSERSRIPRRATCDWKWHVHSLTYDFELNDLGDTISGNEGDV